MAREPSSISSLKKLTNSDPGLADVILSRDNMERADDRTCAIIISTWLEDSLERALLTKMVKLTDIERGELFKGDSLLGSFSSKINIAHAFNIIGKNAKKELNVIRNIRNAFAHCQKSIFFETTEVQNVCQLLTLPERTPNIAEFKRFEPPIKSARERFIASSTLYSGALMCVTFPGLLGSGPKPAPLD